MLRKMLALVCCGTLFVLPAWPSSDPVGHFAAVQGAEVSGVDALPGTTVFDGDTITVPAGGAATLYLSGGSVLQLSGGTSVRLARGGGRVNVRIHRGAVRLSSSAREPSAVRIADLVFSPASPGSASVAMASLRDGSTVELLAERGNWSAYTAGNEGPSAAVRRLGCHGADHGARRGAGPGCDIALGHSKGHSEPRRRTCHRCAYPDYAQLSLLILVPLRLLGVLCCPRG